MKKQNRLLKAGVIILSIAAFLFFQKGIAHSADDYGISSYVVDSGGGHISVEKEGKKFDLYTSIAQPSPVGEIEADLYKVQAGFEYTLGEMICSVSGPGAAKSTVRIVSPEKFPELPAGEEAIVVIEADVKDGNVEIVVGLPVGVDSSIVKIYKSKLVNDEPQAPTEIFRKDTVNEPPYFEPEGRAAVKITLKPGDPLIAIVVPLVTPLKVTVTDIKPNSAPKYRTHKCYYIWY